jgi:hypothetical protein
MLNKSIIIHAGKFVEYTQLMILLENDGYTWGSGKKPTSTPSYFHEYKEDFAVYLSTDKTLSFGSYKNAADRTSFTLMTFESYLALHNKKQEQPNLNKELMKAIRKISNG